MNERLEQVGSAAAGIAHDINNQLTLILNYLEITNVEAAKQAAFRCSALTGSLLSYCRGESVRMRGIEVAEFLRSFIQTLSVPAQVHLVLEVPAGLPEINGDQVALTRVLTNLVTNAFDAMQGAGTVRIAASPWMIEVHDSGPGIEPEHLRQVFKPFFSTKGSAGTGLGLAIVRDIMRQHGGAVTATSEPGQGARFQLRFRR